MAKGTEITSSGQINQISNSILETIAQYDASVRSLY